MKRWVREFRLIPVVLFATVCLFVLKVFGLVLDGGYTLSEMDLGRQDRLRLSRAAGPSTDGPRLGVAENSETPVKRAWAQDVLNYPGAIGPAAAEKPYGKSAEPTLVTGSVAAEKVAKENADKAAGEQKTDPKAKAPAGKVIQFDTSRQSPAERAILERLGERRQELDTRSREIEIRENLLKAQEKQLENRIHELSDAETRVNGAVNKRSEAEAARFKALVIMYETMKAKDAAKIFDRLDLKILVEVVSQINPRRMADILGQMSPEAAEKLTVELAQMATAPARPRSENDLPKIEGQPARQ